MRGFLKTVYFCSLMALSMTPQLTHAKEPAPAITFGLIADVQYGNIPPNGTRFYANSLAKLKSCVEQFNAHPVEFTVNLGDHIDRDPHDLNAVLEQLAQLKAPLYNTTGNHDYKGVTDNYILYQKLGMPAEYYSFTKKGWRFLMLNTNEIASYSQVKGTGKDAELEQMKARITSDKRNNGQSWNGGISSKQKEWLADQLKTAQTKKENVLVFSHHPLYPFKEFTALNDKEILEILSHFPCVRAVISGHHHTGAYGEYKSIPCVTVEGMVETEQVASYALVEITASEINITGSGKAKSHKIQIKDGSIPSQKEMTIPARKP